MADRTAARVLAPVAAVRPPFGLSLEAGWGLALTVLAALATAPPAPNGRPPEAPAEDRLLTPEEAAAALRVTPRWLYRHAQRLPFTRRLSRKALRFSEAGLRRWRAAHRP